MTKPRGAALLAIDLPSVTTTTTRPSHPGPWSAPGPLWGFPLRAREELAASRGLEVGFLTVVAAAPVGATPARAVLF